MCLSIEHIEITYVHRITCNYTIVSWSITYVYDDLLLIFLPLIKDWNLNDFFLFRYGIFDYGSSKNKN